MVFYIGLVSSLVLMVGLVVVQCHYMRQRSHLGPVATNAAADVVSLSAALSWTEEQAVV